MSALVCSTTGLAVAYRDDPVLYDVDFAVPTGAIMGIIGPNGAGKSTLIKAMLGLVKPLTGTIDFFGQPLSKVRRRVGYMPQSTSVDWDFPTTVVDVVTMGTYGSLGWFRRPGKRERARAMTALEQTGMTAFANRQIGELSGGQRQRVFLARTLVQDPDLYFMDEPFQGIDATSQQAIVEVLHALQRSGKTVVIVHHDLATVADYCDHVTLLNRQVIASGPVAETFTRQAIATTYDVSVEHAAFLEFAS
ncbi:MAG: metal ABC transporter ATP-binding protein [Yaniella sp.]|uniref:metal ABC transporter ATP-binding protein n=1 Tax=Yaniella sp. TaxID=2773929 RepID=UPI003F998D64